MQQPAGHNAMLQKVAVYACASSVHVNAAAICLAVQLSASWHLYQSSMWSAVESTMLLVAVQIFVSSPMPGISDQVHSDSHSVTDSTTLCLS